MKKIFCDCCGEEFKYDDRLAAVNGKTQPVRAITPKQADGWDITADLTINFTKTRIAGTTAGSEHVDLCADCRWKVLDKLDPRPKVPAVEWKCEPMDLARIHDIFHKHAQHNGQMNSGYEVSSAAAYIIYKEIFNDISGKLPS